MEMEMNEDPCITVDATIDTNETIARLTAAASHLEQTIAALEQKITAAEQRLATLETGAPFMTQPHRGMGGVQTTEIEAGAPFVRGLSRTGGVESTEIEAGAPFTGCPTSRRDVGSRKTLPTAMTTLLAKQGVSLEATALEASSIDAALASLTIEQRIAVKAQLLRAGLVS